MALNPQTTTDLSTGLMSYLEKMFLSILRKNLILLPYGKKKSLSKGQGKTMDWRRWSDLSAATTALTEGVTPSGASLTLNSVSATLAQYGNFVTVTDILSLTFINDVMKEALDVIGYNASLTLDQIVRNELDTGLTLAYADAANNSSEANVSSGSDVLRSNELRIITETLHGSDVPEYEDGYFIGVIHPKVEGDLMGETGTGTALEAYKYTTREQVERGVIGTAYGIKLKRSSNIRAVTANVYRNIFFGKDAFGVVDVMGSSKPEIIVSPTGSGGTEDALKQRATIAWKTYFVTKVLEAARGISMASYSA